MHRHFLLLLIGIVAFSVLAPEGTINAQPKGAPAIAVAPQAPTITGLTPNGAQRGSTLELNLTGTNLQDPLALWTSFPCKASFPTDNNNGKDAAKLRVKLEVPADAPIGLHTLRVATRQGVSNARVICVDDLPQVVEVDTNRAKTTAQSIRVPVVVVGRADAEASDFFKIQVEANQRLTFEVLSRRLGSPFDPIILVRDAKTGREMPGLYSDDALGLQGDARLTHTFKDAGEFLIEVRDSTFRGGADFHYRLRIGDFPAAIATLPAALKRGTKTSVQFAGAASDNLSALEVDTPADPAVNALQVAPKGKDRLGWPVSVAISDMPEILEQEPNNERAKAQRLTLPTGVTGRFLEKGDLDWFVFSAKKGTKFVILAETMEIASPTEAYIVLKDAKNAELAKSNPMNPLNRIEYTAADDGDIFIVAEHLNFAHGPSEVYHLVVKAVEPDFDVTLSLDRFEVIPGGSTFIPVATVARRDYTGPIELNVVGHPGLEGKVTIPAGPVVVPKAPAPQPGQVVALLPLKAKGDLKPGVYSIRVVASATVEGKTIHKLATVTELVRAGFNNLAVLPRHLLPQISVAVIEKPLFTVTAKLASDDVKRGAPAILVLTAQRDMGFNEDITVTAVGLPANVTLTTKPIAKGTNEVQIPLTAAPNAALGQFTFALRATAKFQNKDYATFTNVVPLTISTSQVPFELKAEPSPLMLKTGAKAKLKVTATRKKDFNAAIQIELKNLPANVTAPKATIPMGKNEVEIEISAAANAPTGDKTDVQVVGTVGKDSTVAPNVTLRIQK